MKHNFQINCLTGDIINYYANMRFGKLYKDAVDPNVLKFHIDLNKQRECTANILVTDGHICELDTAQMHIESDIDKTIEIGKEISINHATYVVHVIYTKVAASYIAETVYIYMENLEDVDRIYGEVPNDIYFW